MTPWPRYTYRRRKRFFSFVLSILISPDHFFSCWHSEHATYHQNFHQQSTGPYTTTTLSLWIQHKCWRVYHSPDVFFYYFGWKGFLPLAEEFFSYHLANYLGVFFLPPSNPVEAANKITSSSLFVASTTISFPAPFIEERSFIDLSSPFTW